MNKLDANKRAAVVRALVEGNSIRATVRMTGVAKNTITKLLADLGEACAAFQDETMRDLPCTKLQVDEIWSFCYSKQKNVPVEHQGEWGYGDIWTWTAICADTKIVPYFFLGGRDAEAAEIFMLGLAHRLKNRVQLTSDGHRAYLHAVPFAFGNDIDYAMLVKQYGTDAEGEKRYSPAKCIGCDPKKIIGNPDPAHINTSYAERQNLTMRMSMRRFTRLTNGFSKKVDNLVHSVSLHFMYYNFGRVHQTLKQTPAMATGIADHVWSVEEIVGLLDHEFSN